jgi:hypothetical protein
MKRIITNLAAISVAVVSIALAATPANAGAPFPATAHAFFERLNPFDPSGCNTLKLDLQVTANTASADYWARNTCFNFDSPHLTGSTAVVSGQVSFDSFKSASVTNIVIAVTGAGFFQQFTFNLVWTQDGHITVTPPTGGTGQVTAQAPGAVTGSVVDLGGNHLFSGSDVADAEITAVFHTLG